MRLKPSMRDKVRYMVFETMSQAPIGRNEAFHAIDASFRRLAGEAEAGMAGMQLLPKLWNSETQRGMLRIHRKHLDQLRASLCLIIRIGRKKTLVRSVGVSGMLNKAKARYLL